MKKIFLLLLLPCMFGCKNKSGELNLSDNTRYHTEVINLTDSAGRLADRKESDSAATIMEKAIDLQKYLMAFRDSVKIYEDKKEYQLAINKTIVATQEVPNFADAYYKLGVLYCKLGDEPKSLVAFGEARKLYENMSVGKMTDRNRFLNRLNLVKIAIYTGNENEIVPKTVQEMLKSVSTNEGDNGFAKLNNITKKDLLSRTEPAIN